MAETTKQKREKDLKLMIPELVSIVTNKTKHQDYERVTKLATNYRAFVTGDGLDDMMRRFTMRETEAAFEQRQEITQHIIPSGSISAA